VLCHLLQAETKSDTFKKAGSGLHIPTVNVTGLALFPAENISEHGISRTHISDIEPGCWNSNIMAPLVRSASRFLFPCTVEYSLLCAVILGVMWINACSDDKTNQSSPQTPDSPAGRVSGVNIIYSRSVSQFSVDCTSAHKGLFGGILMLVLSIVSLIMFYELVKRPELVEVAVLQVSLPDGTGKCRRSYRFLDQNSVFQFPFCPKPPICPAYFIMLTFGEQYKTCSCSICDFLQSSLPFFLLDLNFPLIQLQFFT
jgi:hypothetical protein